MSGLGGKNVSKAMSEREIIDAKIKAATGFTPGGMEYAVELEKYKANPKMYGIRKPKKNVTPNQRQNIAKATGGDLGKVAQSIAERNNKIKNKGILGFAVDSLFGKNK